MPQQNDTQVADTLAVIEKEAQRILEAQRLQAVEQAKRLGPGGGLLISGHPQPEFDGMYKRVEEADNEYHESWPRYEMSSTKHLYRYIGTEGLRETWRICTFFTPLTDHAAASIVTEAGAVPLGVQTWRCWDDKMERKKLTVTELVRTATLILLLPPRSRLFSAVDRRLRSTTNPSRPR